MNVLVLEDDPELSKYLGSGLGELGHHSRLVTSGHEALDLLADEQFDVAVLDRMVPGLDGLSVMKQARDGGCQTPILMLTALGGIEDRVEALEGGADDYLTKPFAFAEFAARLIALARRPAPQTLQQNLVVGDIEMNLARRTVRRAGLPIDLQPREFSLLEQLMRSPDRVVTRTLLLERIWNFGFDPQTNIVETHMSRLRTKLNQGFAHNAIRTVRGSGYIMNPADD
ncbi:response regulator transcription factor [Novosphingobium resinovorum]|jgi:two-component system OmpR family response regulator|uniref:DNA-binding response regulator n=1 Tax=Novosphingobium resinovorum TaxID=158500 RepID=A0A031JDU8_9SPHN|nr:MULTISPECIES: response regulator transcription factor [Sphingomonadaceae]AOR79603.1 DNA-binding response regulator [Novosphingobium resinovorum]EJU12600.1 two-component response regulator [Sphingomonas sp. LH128]EZP70905.1 Two-component response regulator [Novosphingobium resinovorum]MBF7013455.1 response regulator transcription factor [Novosphingobium sp. HR1a]WJM25603.1 response regulator transcription factor [Novosphingobium resinovorum]